MKSPSLYRWPIGLGWMLASCGSGGGFPADASVDAPPAGRFSVAWSLTDLDGNAIECAQVGGQLLSIEARNRAVLGGIPEVFSCGSGQGTSTALIPGTYDFKFALRGIMGELAVAPEQMGIEIAANQTVELSPLVFAVDDQGALALTLASQEPGGNCAPTAMSAGITTMTITLEHDDDTCEPVTFQIAAGATTSAGTYVVDCQMPVVAPCIESDQILTVTTLPSGPYDIAVRGQIEGTDCWVNTDRITVPPLGQTLETTLNLTKLMTPGC